MTKYSFLNDYSEGCLPEILDALQSTNLTQETPYGHDAYCDRARKTIRAKLQSDSEIFFVSGGTLANRIMISAVLRPHEAVIAASSGHIVTHETGAIEATGHKIITVPTHDGKLTADHVRKAVSDNVMAPHMAKPRLVYISNATETGRIYNKAELQAMSKTCRALGMLLMIDGARLAAALVASENDLTLPDIAELTDMFWFGGTKAGTLFGEAIIINTPELAEDFEYHIKQKGALLAKGRALGVQFQTLFENDRYLAAARHANHLAAQLSSSITAAGHKLSDPTQTNQIFPILPNDLIDRLEQDFEFYRWEVFDENNTVLRLVTSWSTDTAQVKRVIEVLEA